MKDKLVSVVILTWNRCCDLSETLREVEKSTYSALEILVVDNCSTDGTAEMVKKQFPDVTFIALDENVGIAGYNVGFKKAKGEYILVLDNDSFPEINSIKKMVGYFEEFPTLGVAAFDVKNYCEKERQLEFGPGQGETATGYNGAGAGIRRSCLDKAGALFEPFFLYMNEQDHALRVLQSGYGIRWFPDLVAFHKQSASSRSSEKMAYFYTRNLLWMIWRNYPLFLMFRSTFLIFFFAVLYSVKLRNKVYFRAISDAVVGLKRIVPARSPVDRKIIGNARIPLSLAFSVYG
ncbi:MAG: glycosyltransferase family 2 protein [Nitrospinota bacterium]